MSFAIDPSLNPWAWLGHDLYPGRFARHTDLQGGDVVASEGMEWAEQQEDVSGRGMRKAICPGTQRRDHLQFAQIQGDLTVATITYMHHEGESGLEWAPSRDLTWYPYGDTPIAEVAQEQRRWLADQGFVPVETEGAMIKADPRYDRWTVVGRTSLDGTLETLAALLPFDPVDWEFDHDVRLVGGRHLVLRESAIAAGGAGTPAVHVYRCDVVRRTSEIEAEREAAERAEHEALLGMALPLARCPECGPHGNRGRVVGFDMEYSCTTCAGGRPGDVHADGCRWDDCTALDEVAGDDAEYKARIAALFLRFRERFPMPTNEQARALWGSLDE